MIGDRRQFVDVYHNPTRKELFRLIREARYQVLRGFLEHDDALFVWDADDAIHPEISNGLLTLGWRVGRDVPIYNLHFRRDGPFIDQSNWMVNDQAALEQAQQTIAGSVSMQRLYGVKVALVIREI